MLKALSLTQPWATLVAIGAKTVETRSWRTSYRGPIAIHASKGYPMGARVVCLQEPFRSVLQAEGPLQLGAIVALVQLVDVRPVELLVGCLSPQERAFGDYSAGRYGWVLANVQRLPVPLPCKGALGLWSIPHLTPKPVTMSFDEWFRHV